jgi:hypothetical protein
MNKAKGKVFFDNADRMPTDMRLALYGNSDTWHLQG